MLYVVAVVCEVFVVEGATLAEATFWDVAGPPPITFKPKRRDKIKPVTPRKVAIYHQTGVQHVSLGTGSVGGPNLLLWADLLYVWSYWALGTSWTGGALATNIVWF